MSVVKGGWHLSEGSGRRKWLLEVGAGACNRLLGWVLLDMLTFMLAEKLENRLPADHPALQAALRAPIEAETDEEREAVEAAMNSGQLVPGSMVTAELGRRARRSHG